VLGPRQFVEVAGLPVAVHDVGSGPAVLLLHGSGPGTTAAAWGPLAAVLAASHRVIVPDMAGFGASAGPASGRYGRETWTGQALGLLDALGVESCAVAGNSMGGAIALSIAAARPTAVTRIVAVGTLGLPMPLAPGLEQLWAYEPSRDAAQALLELLYGDPALATDEAVEARLAATLQSPARETFPSLFPAPRQRWVDDLALSDGELAGIAVPVLLVHGSADRVVPLADSALPLLQLLGDVRLHVFGGCGHATPVERPGEFHRLLTTFLEDHD
jgi:2-hydroxymuconate-semialdehyde hydrolase